MDSATPTTAAATSPDATAISFADTDEPTPLRLANNTPSSSADSPAAVAAQLAEAKAHFWTNRFDRAYRLSEKLLKQRPNDWDALAVNIGALVELKNSSQLFFLAHKLVNELPDACISWYAVGCYYYTIGQYESAKRYLAKCTGMIPAYGAGWIVFGHAFAAEREHDQAMNCYIKAAKVLPDSHLPLLYNGLEYSLTNNLRLSEKFLQEANKMKPGDPFVLHELGVLAYRQDQWSTAERHFRSALDLLFESGDTSRSAGRSSGRGHHKQDDDLEEKLQRVLLPTWEPLINNMAHVACKLDKLDQALMFHRKALCLSPRNASTYASMGFVQLMKGDVEDAITMFHRSLAIDNDNAQLRMLLAKTLQVFEEQPQLWSADGDDALWTYVTVPNPIVFNSAQANKSSANGSGVFNRASELPSSDFELNFTDDSGAEPSMEQTDAPNPTAADDNMDV